MLGLNDSMDVLDPSSIEDARKLALNNILASPPPNEEEKKVEGTAHTIRWNRRV